MDQLIYVFIVFASLVIGAVTGYLTRQSLAKKKLGSIEEKLEKMTSQAKVEADALLSQAREKAQKIVETSERESQSHRQEILRA